MDSIFHPSSRIFYTIKFHFFPSVDYRSYNICSKSEMLKMKSKCPLATWNPWNESYLLTRNKCPPKLDRLLSNSSSTGRSTHFLEDRQDRIDLFLKEWTVFQLGCKIVQWGSQLIGLTLFLLTCSDRLYAVVYLYNRKFIFLFKIWCDGKEIIVVTRTFT